LEKFQAGLLTTMNENFSSAPALKIPSVTIDKTPNSEPIRKKDLDSPGTKRKKRKRVKSITTGEPVAVEESTSTPKAKDSPSSKKNQRKKRSQRKKRQVGAGSSVPCPLAKVMPLQLRNTESQPNHQNSTPRLN